MLMPNQHLCKSPPHRSLWLLQITIILTENALLIFFAIRGWKINGMGGWGLNPQSYILVLSQVPMTSQPRPGIKPCTFQFSTSCHSNKLQRPPCRLHFYLSCIKLFIANPRPWLQLIQIYKFNFNLIFQIVWMFKKLLQNGNLTVELSFKNLSWLKKDLFEKSDFQ